MIKKILALSAIVVISACSGGGSNSPTDSTTGPSADQSAGGGQSTGGGQSPGGIVPPAPPGVGGSGDGTVPVGGGAPPAADTKAGTYFGDAGAGIGVYVVNNENYLAGLALAPNGSAKSLFGDLGEGNTFSGSLRPYSHEESVPDGAAGSFGSVAQPDSPLSTNLTIINGQSITGSGISLERASAGQLQTASAASLAGTWSGTHGFCLDLECSAVAQLVTTLVFNGVSVTGSTQVVGDAVVPVQGGITEFGETSLISFIREGTTYTGAAFFVPDGSGRLAFFGESPGANLVTISGLLSRQQ